MQKMLEESDSPELRMQRKPLPTYNFGLKVVFSNHHQNSSPVIIDKEGLDLLNDLKVMADKAKNTENIKENEVSTTAGKYFLKIREIKIQDRVINMDWPFS